VNQRNDPYEQQFWGNTQKHMLQQYKERFEFGGFVIGPDEEFMIIRQPITILEDKYHAEATVASQTGLHIKIDDLRAGVRNLILSKANGTTNNGNFLEAFEYNADGEIPDALINASGAFIGARLTSGGAFTDQSASTLKTNLKDLTERQIESLIEKAKIYRFEYLKEPGVVYIGPVAEEFHELTGWGDVGSISPKSLAGIALRLVQWVWNKVKGYEDRIAKLETKLALMENPSEDTEA